MNGNRWILTTVLGLILAGAAAAQENRFLEVRLESPPEERASTKAHEEVEILRRILNRKLGELYAASGTGLSAHLRGESNQLLAQVYDGLNAQPGFVFYESATPGESNSSAGPNSPYYDLYRRAVVSTGEHPVLLPDAEGVYLKGYGIVYTLTLPPPARPAKAEPARAAGQPLSEWEKERRRLRGEKVDETAAASPPAKQPSLSDAILHVLAEQGKHLSQLAEGEGVTVAVTFRRPTAWWSRLTANRAPAPTGDSGMMPSMGGPANPAMPPGGGGPMMAPGTGPGGNNPPSTARDYTLLGELRAKEGKYDEAQHHYEKALGLLHRDTPQADRDERQLRQRLAQLLVEKGDLDAARKALDQLAALQNRQKQAPHSRSADAQAATPFPGKLIVRVSKALLDQAGTGRMPFEEFKSKASVQLYTPQEPAGTADVGVKH